MVSTLLAIFKDFAIEKVVAGIKMVILIAFVMIVVSYVVITFWDGVICAIWRAELFVSWILSKIWIFLPKSYMALMVIFALMMIAKVVQVLKKFKGWE